MIKEYLKNAKWLLFFRLCYEKIQEVSVLTKYIANGDMNKTARKLETELFICAHSIEKGMSIGAVRAGFGKKKVRGLLKDLQHYIEIGGDIEFVEDVCSIINKYVDFNKQLGCDMDDIYTEFDSFVKFNVPSCVFSEEVGIYKKSYSDVAFANQFTFDKFSQSRFSVRDFGEEKIDFNKVLSALKICQKTPSACNRQSYKIYVYKDENLRNKIFELQGGCKGFYNDMQVAILICGDLCGYKINELNQVYVDSGIYGMNMLYALHYEGLAAIPLTMAFKQKKISLVRQQMNIPENEIPCILIGVGSYKKGEYKVAVSKRKSFEEYTVVK
jgi:nitroreductase